MSATSHTIATIPRPTTGEEVRISVLTSGHRRYVDLRVYSPTRTSKGEPVPTKAGLCLREEMLSDVIKALQTAGRAS